MEVEYERAGADNPPNGVDWLPMTMVVRVLGMEALVGLDLRVWVETRLWRVTRVSSRTLEGTREAAASEGGTEKVQESDWADGITWPMLEAELDMMPMDQLDEGNSGSVKQDHETGSGWDVDVEEEQQKDVKDLSEFLSLRQRLGRAPKMKDRCGDLGDDGIGEVGANSRLKGKMGATPSPPPLGIRQKASKKKHSTRWMLTETGYQTGR
ncbi:hypothetical protein R1sor_018899 [Riccia sorocarpa]|uniref:Uncharacterized protein n=1 Tax=Riccia sorocarpa TaxID=122646 RepID=A0ABD3IB62_9MARC